MTGINLLSCSPLHFIRGQTLSIFSIFARGIHAQRDWIFTYCLSGTCTWGLPSHRPSPSEVFKPSSTFPVHIACDIKLNRLLTDQYAGNEFAWIHAHCLTDPTGSGSPHQKSKHNGCWAPELLPCTLIICVKFVSIVIPLLLMDSHWQVQQHLQTTFLLLKHLSCCLCIPHGYSGSLISLLLHSWYFFTQHLTIMNANHVI